MWDRATDMSIAMLGEDLGVEYWVVGVGICDTMNRPPSPMVLSFNSGFNIQQASVLRTGGVISWRITFGRPDSAFSEYHELEPSVANKADPFVGCPNGGVMFP